MHKIQLKFHFILVTFNTTQYLKSSLTPMEYHDLQKCIRQHQAGPGCKEENPAQLWLLTTVWHIHVQQNRGRWELNEENLAPLRLQLGFSQCFYCFMMRQRFISVKQPSTNTQSYMNTQYSGLKMVFLNTERRWWYDLCGIVIDDCLRLNGCHVMAR